MFEARRGAAGSSRARRVCNRWAGLLLLWQCLGASCDERATSRGLVFFDRDRDGVFSAGDDPLTGGHIVCETEICGEIAPDGRYTARIPPGRSSIIWVRSGGGTDPGPFWVEMQGVAGEVADIPVRPVSGRGPFSFVAASDTHAGIGVMDPADQILGLVQATDIDPRPYFIAVTGDITQSNKPEQFDSVLAGVAAIDVPYVPVPGNHDWYDGGAAYRRVFGPPTYSFDSGGLHFIVLNDADSLDARLRFVDADLALVDAAAPVVVLMHAPPREDLLRALERRGVEYLLTGHMHSNRVMVHDQAVEYNTQPLVMGGIDLTPGGSRVFTRTETGRLISRGRTTINQPILRLVAPAADQVAPACQVQFVAAVEPGTTVREVRARVDGAEMDVPLQYAGGWSYRSEVLALCEAGAYMVEVTVALADGSAATIQEIITVGAPPPVTGVADWPMLQGDPRHTGASERPISPPLVTRWVTAVGGHVQGGAPVVADGRVFVPVSDFGEGTPGGVVALDAATGAMLWATQVGFSVRNAPAVSDGLVVFLSNDGMIHALEAATGRSAWAYELAPHVPQATRSAYSSPTIVDGVVYAGVRRELVALDLRSGEVIWTHDPIGTWGDLASHVSPAVVGDVLIQSFDRAKEGLIAFDRGTGIELWRTSGSIPQHMHASPVVADGAVYVINELTQVTALELETGFVRWQRQLGNETFGWGYLSAATPAYHAGMLFVGTQQGHLFALDAATSDEIWRFEGAPSLIRATHYHGEIAAFPAAPVITPGVVWAASPDGLLRALDAGTGALLWSYDLGVPVTASPAAAGAILVVASFDGTVRALSAP